MADVKITIGSVKSITGNIDTLTKDLSEMVNDKELTDAMKNAIIVIGNLFSGIYE